MKTKLKVFALSLDRENCGTEVEIYPSEKAFHDRLVGIMEERITELEQTLADRFDEQKRLQIGHVKDTIARGAVMEAWDYWRDKLMPEDDIYVWEEEEIEFPAGRILLEVQGGVIQTAYADDPRDTIIVLDHDASEVDGERELENRELAKVIPEMAEVRLWHTAVALTR